MICLKAAIGVDRNDRKAAAGQICTFIPDSTISRPYAATVDIQQLCIRLWFAISHRTTAVSVPAFPQPVSDLFFLRCGTCGRR